MKNPNVHHKQQVPDFNMSDIHVFMTKREQHPTATLE